MQVSNVSSNALQLQGNISGEFHKGQNISAKVVDNANGTLILDTGDGKLITAQNTTSLSLSKGDNISLTITGSGKSVTASITVVNDQPVSAQITQSDFTLVDLDLPITTANTTALAILTKLNMPVTKEMVQGLATMIEQGISPQEALPLIQNNLIDFAAYKDALENMGNFQKDLSAFAKNIISDISQSSIDSYSEIIAQNSLKSTINAKNFTTNLGQNTNNEVLNGQTFSNGQISDLSSALFNQIIGNSGETSSHFTQNILPKLLPQILEFALNDNFAGGQSVNNGQSESNGQIVNQENSSLPSQALPDQGNANSANIVPKNVADTLSLLPPSMQQEFAALLPEIKGQIFDIKALMNHKILTEQGFANVKDADIATTLKELPKLLAQVIKGEGLDPKLSSALKLSNDTMNFYQIPININDYKTQAEMYVVKRDAKKALSLKNGVKILFALNTENLGRVETLITAKDKTLSLQIYGETDSATKLINDNIDLLTQLIKTTGFNLQGISVNKLQEPTTANNYHKHLHYSKLDISL